MFQNHSTPSTVIVEMEPHGLFIHEDMLPGLVRQE